MAVHIYLKLMGLCLLGYSLSACQQTTDYPHPLPKQAQGNEPSWHIQFEANLLVLRQNAGQEQQHIFFQQQPTAQGWLLTSKNLRSFTLELTHALCHDSMTGMPYPWQATLSLNQQQLTGCAGETMSLLTGEWQIQSINQQAVIADSNTNIIFDTQGKVSGFAGCNRYNSHYQLSGEGIQLTDNVSTKRTCQAALMQQETNLFTALTSITHLNIDTAGQLVLTGQDEQVIIAKRRDD